MSPRTWRRWLTGLLLLWLAMVAVSWWQARESALEALASQLRRSLPEQIASAEVNRIERREFADYLVGRINRDLARTRPDNVFALVRHCSTEVLTLGGKRYAVPGLFQRTVDLQLDSGELSLATRCTTHSPRLLASRFVLALVGIVLLAALPAPLSPRRRQWVRALVDAGVGRWQARRLTRRIDDYSDTRLQLLTLLLASNEDPEDAIRWLEDRRLADLDGDGLEWFARGLEIHHGDIEQALAIACAEPVLELRAAEAVAVCHGVAIKLASTPFFYYYWYAQRRVLGIDGGWYTNPPARGADAGVGEELVTLMERHGGHSKAVRDIRDKGLRAKTLDQNRSKIKDEISAVMGESLARDYLFEMSRDERTARYNYRLALTPGRIICS